MKEKRRRKHGISSPLVNNLDNDGKQRKVTDYTVNIRAILSSCYAGTGCLDIGLINSCQCIAGSENWERSYTRHSKPIYKAIIKVTDEIIDESLNEKVALTIKEKLKGKYIVSEIDEFIAKKLLVLQRGLMK